MTVTRAPLAFVYDRCASRSHRQLHMRLEGCHHYAERMGWGLAGRWFDLGDHALSTHRPQLDSMLAAMRTEAGRREVVCLVHTWERLATDATHRQLLQRRIVKVGGRTATTFGDCDRPTRGAVLLGRHP
ncbi:MULTISPECIES: recombinase family protein [unclassified Streptomyces]|uniref:recombinase family protein n=1 Tax=unclassified Streptomyces TaxID=2593676 RepID=UPI00036233AD|nr:MULTISPECIES: recombinase family protein [unclassified Streptomyces]MYT30916.1 recombinase family protein [Streptomyces sp. SID8354]